MSLKIAYVIRDGGGTAPVELTVATKLRERGHDISLYGPPEVHDHVRSAGFALNELGWPPGLPNGPEDLMPRMIGAARAWARQLVPVFQDADLVVSDCAAFGALIAARLAGVPSAGLMPTVYVAAASESSSEVRRAWAAALQGINRARTDLWLDPVASVTEQLLDVDRLLVLTSRAFELPTVQPPENVCYVGPQLQPAPPSDFAVPNGAEPLVLVSLSTTDQDQNDLLHRIIAALRTLPVRAVITVGPAVDPDQFDVPDRLAVERFVPHAAILPHADLVITHAGHGTVMAAVTAGVPLVCLPMGRDQPAVAERVSHHGLGIRLDPVADVDTIATAVRTVLAAPSYRAATQRLATKIEPADKIVTELEALARGGVGEGDRDGPTAARIA